MAPKDWIVETGVRDESALAVIETTNQSPFIGLQPLFGTEGDDDAFVHFRSGAIYKEFYGGDEIMNVEKFGQGPLNGYQILQGGGELLGYRLTAPNAKRAAALVSLHVKADAAIPLWQREANGAYKLDGTGNKIMVDDPGQAGQQQLTAAGHVIKLVVEAVTGDIADISPNSGTAAGGWTTFPLFAFYHTAKGKCGEKYGITLDNDLLRDKVTSDGRRYMLNLWKKKPSGDSVIIADTIRFSLAPKAERMPNSGISEYVEQIYPKTDLSGRKTRIQMRYFPSSYDAINELLAADMSSGTVLDLDFIFGTTKLGYTYDKIVVDPASVNLKTAINFLLGGSDGSLQLGETIDDPENVGQTLTVDAARVAATKKQLLIDFFNCDLNQEILDARIVDAGHVFDANYENDVKEAMIGGLNSFRPDIHIWADVGIVRSAAEGLTAFEAVKPMIPADTSYSYTVVAFAGRTLESRPQEVTGTYELARSMPASFTRYGWFIPVAGYFTGELRFMETNFVVTITKDDMIGKYKDNGLIFPRKLSRDGHIAIMEEVTQYVNPFSKLKSTRNAMVVEDAQRVCVQELPKFAFDPEGAEATIKEAKEHLTSIFSSRYPRNVKVTIEIYQTNYDIATNNAHCKIVVTFPDILETFTVEVVARREQAAA